MLYGCGPLLGGLWSEYSVLWVKLPPGSVCPLAIIFILLYGLFNYEVLLGEMQILGIYGGGRLWIDLPTHLKKLVYWVAVGQHRKFSVGSPKILRASMISLKNKNLDKFIRAAFHKSRHITRRSWSQYFYTSFTRTFVILWELLSRKQL